MTVLWEAKLEDLHVGFLKIIVTKMGKVILVRGFHAGKDIRSYSVNIFGGLKDGRLEPVIKLDMGVQEIRPVIKTTLDEKSVIVLMPSRIDVRIASALDNRG